MANPTSFFAKLFGSKLFRFRFRRTKKHTDQNVEKDALPRRPLQLAQEQRQKEAPKPEPVDPYALSLPVDHVIYELWRACRDQAGWLPRPELHFRTDPQVFDESTAMKELTKFMMSMSASAQARLSAMRPPTPVADGANKAAGIAAGRAAVLEADEAFRDTGAEVPQNEPDLSDPALEPELPPPPDLDAQVTVYIAGDQLSAWLLCYPPSGEGKGLTKAAVMGALGAAGVGYGVDEQAVEALPGREDAYFHLHLIALGKPAQPGKDGQIIDLFPREAHRELPVDEEGRVDFSGLGTTQNVEKGAAICHITQPTPGVAGRTVTDKELPTRDGVPVPPPMGRNTALSEDGASLIATRDGGLEFSGRAFQVNPLLEIAGNVDYSSGSVNFLGDVHIHGDVCTGFSVRAMGNIKVDGVVESCNIEAGGDLILAKGVQGNNQAVIRAHRDIFAKYLENCSVHAQENLHSECIVSCQVYSDAGVYVQSGRGAIIGGKIRAAREVDANIVGSKTEVHTTVVLGGLPCEDYERKQLAEEIAELEKTLAETEKQPSSPTKLSRMSRMRMQISVNKLKLNQHLKALEELQEGLDHRPAGRLTFRTAYPGTKIRIGESVLALSNETRHSIATLIDGEVKLIT